MLPFEGFGQQNATAAAAPPKQPQARAPKTQSFGADVFKPGKTTTLRWLGGEGFMVNARGTTLMIDLLLEGFDIKVMIEEPILPAQVPHLNAVLITHSDSDHYSVQPCKDLLSSCQTFGSTQYVAPVMTHDGEFRRGTRLPGRPS